MAIPNKFQTWLFGFSAAKNKYPEPWKSSSAFTDSRTLTTSMQANITAEFDAAGMSDDAPLLSSILARNTTRTLQAIRRQCYYAALSGNVLLVEYHSSKEGVIEVVAYDRVENTLSACVVTETADGERSFTPMNYLDGSSSGVSVYITLLLGACIANKTHSSNLARLLANVLPAPEEDDANMPNAGWAVVIGARLYKVVNGSSSDGDNWMGATLDGIGNTGSITRLNEMDLVALAEKAIPLGPYSDPDPYVEAVCAGATMMGLIKEDTVFFADIPSCAEEPHAVTVTSAMADLCAELALDIHELTPAEKAMVPVLGPNYVVDSVLLEAARTIKADWKFPGLDLAPNFILEGDAGSGKTAATKFFAHVFGLPRTKMTMHPLFESSNLIGAFFPVFSDISDWDLDEDDERAMKAVRDAVEQMDLGSDAPQASDIDRAIRRAFASEEVRDIVRTAYGIPTELDIAIDPDAAWAKLGKSSPVPDEVELARESDRVAQNKLFRLMNIMCEKAENGGVSYRFILSELMRGFQNGWCIEIQEAASVLRPGVLTELNSLLEPNGRIELPNGSYITRHPDTLVFFTTNRDYAGNVDLNESLRDRCMMGIKMDLPPAKVMATRAMQQTGFTDEKVALYAAETVMQVAEEAKARNIRGSFGMRSLLGWMLSLRRGDYSEQAFRQRVIEKMTTRDDDMQILLTAYRNSPFASNVAKTKKRA